MQESIAKYIIYGGIIGLDSSETLYIVDLNTFQFQAIPAREQKEKNGRELPGPRDDFCFVTVSGTGEKEGGLKPMYVVGGFRNGSKMNDLYKLHIVNNNEYVWELFEVKSKKPEPRSAFSACCTLADPG